MQHGLSGWSRHSRDESVDLSFSRACGIGTSLPDSPGSVLAVRPHQGGGDFLSLSDALTKGIKG